MLGKWSEGAFVASPDFGEKQQMEQKAKMANGKRREKKRDGEKGAVGKNKQKHQKRIHMSHSESKKKIEEKLCKSINIHHSQFQDSASGESGIARQVSPEGESTSTRASLSAAGGGDVARGRGVTYATNDASMKRHQVFELLLHFD